VSSDEQSEGERTVANKKNINSYIFYQHGSMKLTYGDMLTCRNMNLLSDICIEAFMKSFKNEKMLVLSYFDASKIALTTNVEEINLSIKVNNFENEL